MTKSIGRSSPASIIRVVRYLDFPILPVISENAETMLCCNPLLARFCQAHLEGTFSLFVLAEKVQEIRWADSKYSADPSCQKLVGNILNFLGIFFAGKCAESASMMAPKVLVRQGQATRATQT